MFNFKKNNSVEFQDLKQVLESRDELRFNVCLNEFFTSIQSHPTMKSEKKLVIYDLITRLSNCGVEERAGYLKKIGKIL